jgi:hypothetical protein
VSDSAEAPALYTTREGVLVTLALIAVIGVQLVAVDAQYLFSKYFWIDELCTYAAVADPDLAHMLQGMRGGMDTMPTFNLIARALSAFIAPSEVYLRGVAFGSVVLALSGVYAGLRRSVPPVVALTAVFVVWAHPLSRAHAFDARPYGPYLAASVWFCYWVDRRQTSPDRRTALALAATSLALCSIHVFGGLVWAIVLVAAGIVFRRWRPLWPALLGPVPVPALWMLAVQPQRDAVAIPTWEPAFTWARAAEMGETVLLPGFIGIVFLAIWGVLCVQRVFTPRVLRPDMGPPATPLLLLTSLSLLVPLIVLLSLLFQPTLTHRYAIPAVAALAPAVAYGVMRLPRWGCAVILAVLLVSTTYGLRRNAIQARWEDQQTDAVANAIRELPADRQVVFEVAHVIAVVWHYSPDLRSRVALLDFETGQVPNATRLRMVSRDLARIYNRFYAWPPLVSWEALRSSPEFYFSPDVRAYLQPIAAEMRYPGFTITPVNPLIRKATRR